MSIRFTICLSVFAATGCAFIDLDTRPATGSPPDEPAIRPAARPIADLPPADARTADEFDTTSAEQRAAAVVDGPSGTSLGSTIASLGDVAEPGFWLETPLVDSVQAGRVAAANGRTLEVELRPINGGSGSGSRISLAAMRLLNIPLTELPELQVFTN